MYYIKRNSTMPKKLRGPFFSYEEARSAVRKYLRAKLSLGSHNASISDYGFSISKA